jgi:formaldehyde-activating enzyme involved in methanogenesis
MLRLQLPILANHGRGVTSSHDGANALLSLSGGVATAVCESEEAYIVSNERASTVIVATAVNFLDTPEPNI